MKIPLTTVKPRFYVATSEKHAFSSWGTLEEALACIDRFQDASDSVKNDIQGVYEISPKGGKWAYRVENDMADTDDKVPVEIVLQGKFTPPGERGPSNAEELIEQINDFFLNNWEGCGSLRFEIVGQEGVAVWACTSCTWTGPKPRLDSFADVLMCPDCDDDVERIIETQIQAEAMPEQEDS